MKEPLVVSYGGGVNSTAMLIEMHDRGIRPDAILFADTGDEHRETYKYVSLFSGWLVDKGLPAITTVKKDSEHKSLSDECFSKKTLPSLAFGFRSCSDHWKIRPQTKWIKSWDVAQEAWGSGLKVVKGVGIDAGESHRQSNYDDKRYRVWFPLVEWDIDRNACVEIIESAGLGMPPKSSCWHCPAKKKHEVVAMSVSDPCLFNRAVEMERNAIDKCKSVKGLGRHWSWEAIGKADESQLKLFPEPPAIPCMCDDGVGD